MTQQKKLSWRSAQKEDILVSWLWSPTSHEPPLFMQLEIWSVQVKNGQILLTLISLFLPNLRKHPFLLDNGHPKSSSFPTTDNNVGC